MSTTSEFALTPTQKISREELLKAVRSGCVVHFHAETGMGKTAVLESVHKELGGVYLTNRELMEAAGLKHPLQLEDVFYSVVLDAMKAHDIVFVDNFQLINNIFCCNHFYPRLGFFTIPMLLLCDYAAAVGKKLVLCTTGDLTSVGQRCSHTVQINRFEAADYAALCGQWLGPDMAKRVDFGKVFRYAPKLNGYQLRSVCEGLRSQNNADTESFIEYLRTRRMASNVDLAEVEAVDLARLKGVDDVLRSLELNIVLPLENDELATELGLRPKRGVLLYGPPGTGKTTIGKALAHRLKSKFFLIDGTFIAGTADFFQRLQQIFEAAKENAPAVIFFDDADAIFEEGTGGGLYRFLLTALDGLESEAVGRICLMMTAMNLNNLPPALVRSGRVELWLEMKLPDAQAREMILQQHLSTLPQDLRNVNESEVLAATDGFTGADMKRLVEDAKGLYAFDRTNKQTPREFTAYLLDAVNGIRENRARFLQAEAAAQGSQGDQDRLVGRMLSGSMGIGLMTRTKRWGV